MTGDSHKNLSSSNNNKMVPNVDKSDRQNYHTSKDGMKEKNIMDQKSCSVQVEFIPPDGGWGWMVLLGTFMALFITSGVYKLCGLLLINIVKDFHATTFEASIISSLMMSLLNIMGPIARILCYFYTPRLVVMISGVALASGLILTSFVHKVEILYFTVGILVGCAGGLAIIPSIVVICDYFKKRRGLASGIMMSGSSFGAVIFPPLMTYLVEEYGLRGALLILGGFSLHIFVAGALLQPVKAHLIRVVNEIRTNSNVVNDLMDSTKYVMNVSMTSLEPVKEVSEIDYSSEPFNHVSIEIDKDTSCKDYGEYPNVADKDETDSILASTDVNNSILSIPHSTALSFNRRKIISKSSSLSSSFLHLSMMHLDPNFDQNVDSKHVKDEKTQNLEAHPKNLFYRILFKLRFSTTLKFSSVIDLSWLWNTQFNLLGAANVMTALPWYGILIFLPLHMNEIGISTTQIAYILSAIALTDFTGRIFFPWLYDFGCCHIKYWYMLGACVAGFSVILFTCVTSFEYIILSATIYGFFSGCYSGLCSLIYVEILGEDNVASSYSLSLLICGLFILGMPPMIGWMKEFSGSYNNCFMILGIIEIFGGLVLLLESCAARYETKKEFLRIENSNRCQSNKETQTSCAVD